MVSAPLCGSDGGETAGFLNRSKTLSMFAFVLSLAISKNQRKKFAFQNQKFVPEGTEARFFSRFRLLRCANVATIFFFAALLLCCASFTLAGKKRAQQLLPFDWAPDFSYSACQTAPVGAIWA